MLLNILFPMCLWGACIRISYLSNTLTNLCIALYCILLYCVVLNYIVLLIYCFVDIIQYNAMHKFVGVLDNSPGFYGILFIPQKQTQIHHIRVFKCFVFSESCKIVIKPRKYSWATLERACEAAWWDQWQIISYWGNVTQSS